MGQPQQLAHRGRVVADAADMTPPSPGDWAASSAFCAIRAPSMAPMRSCSTKGRSGPPVLSGCGAGSRHKTAGTPPPLGHVGLVAGQLPPDWRGSPLSVTRMMLLACRKLELAALWAASGSDRVARHWRAPGVNLANGAMGKGWIDGRVHGTLPQWRPHCTQKKRRGPKAPCCRPPRGAGQHRGACNPSGNPSAQ